MTADPTPRSTLGADGPPPVGTRTPAGGGNPAADGNPVSPPTTSADTWCPSAAPGPDAVVFAVRTSDPEQHGVRYLDRALPVTQEILDLADPVDPREVFRFGAPCATTGCVHFTGSRCSLVQRIVDQLAPAVDDLPPCRLRARCRWFAEEGGAACLRCPVILTRQPRPDPDVARAAAPVLLGMPAMVRSGDPQPVARGASS